MSTPSTPSTLTSSPLESYEFKRIKVEDKEKVLEHLRRFFFRDELLTVSIKLAEFEIFACKEQEDLSINPINDGLSVMAVTSSGNIIGVAINEHLERTSEDDFISSDPKFSKIVDFLNKLDEEADVFGKFPDVDRIFDMYLLSVDEAWRKRGIGRELLEKSREIAKQEGYQLIRGDCISTFSAKALCKMGFECIYTLKYEDYKENGKPVFTLPDPHKEAKIYVQRISNSTKSSL